MFVLLMQYPFLREMKVFLSLVLLVRWVEAFCPRTSTTSRILDTAQYRARSTASQLQMAAIPDGGNVLCIGSGPVLLLAAKKAALRGYETSIISGASTETYRELLYESDAEELSNLKLLETITGPMAAEFDALLAKTDAVIIAIDGDAAIGDGLVDIVMQPGGSVKRVVAMSRNLNGKGMGPFVVSSKALANSEVWSCNTKDEYERFESKLKSACAATGAEYVVCRAGTLKGGGPAGDDAVYSETKRTGLSYGFYSFGQQDIVNWRLLFDCNTQGVTLTPGDEVAGPGFGAVFAATASDQRPGDTGRHGIAGAMVHALGHGPGNRDFAVGTAEGKSPPTEAEWGELFAGLLL